MANEELIKELQEQVSEDVDKRSTIGTETTQALSFFGVDGAGQQTAPTYPGLISISGSGDDADINTNFSRLESWQDDVIGVLKTYGLTD